MFDINAVILLEMIEIPCRCGHILEKHHRDNGHDMFCNECWDRIQSGEMLIPFVFTYHEYIPDNLLFVEQEAQKRNLI